MKRWIHAAIAIFFIFCLQNQAHAKHRCVDGVIIGGGAGAIMGQAIGQNVESTILGATVGSIVGAVIASERSPSHHRPVLGRHPGGHHKHHFNYAPRLQPPRAEYRQLPDHGRKHFKKGHRRDRGGYERDSHHYRSDHNRHHHPHHRDYSYR